MFRRAKPPARPVKTKDQAVRAWLHTADPKLADRLQDALDTDDQFHGYPAPRFADRATGRLAAGFGDEQKRALAVWAQLIFCLRGQRSTSLEGLLLSLARQKLAWTAAETRVLFRAAFADVVPSYRIPDVLRLPLAAAERLDDNALRGLGDQLAIAIAYVKGGEYYGDRPRLLAKTAALLARLEGTGDDALPDDFFGPDDSFGRTVRAQLPDLLDRPGSGALLRHCRAAHTAIPAAGVPAEAWSRTLRELLDTHPAVAEVAGTVLGLLPAHRPTPVTRRHRDEQWTEQVYLPEETADLLRGLVWTVAELDGDWVPGLLGEVALAAGSPWPGNDVPCEKLASAAITALGRRGGDASVAQLVKIGAKVRRKALRERVTAALDVAAAQAGLTSEQLLERTVPAYGFGRDGTRVELLGDHAALLALTPDGVTVRYRTAAGRTVAGAPKAVREAYPDELAAVRAVVREVKQALPAERLRVDTALGDGRLTTVANWRRYWLDHPVTGAFARRLLWEVCEDGEWRGGWPARAGGVWRLTDPLGVAAHGDHLSGDAPVRLWHPIRAGAGEIQRWRESLLGREIRQPVKQAFREVYALTAAERSTGTYSNRFAAHILRYGPAKAFLIHRGWTGLTLGYWDGGFDGAAERVYADAAGGSRWRASFWLDLVEREEDAYSTVSFCATDQVRFDLQTPDDGWERAELAAVPPLVLSEAFRDIDEAVSVATIAADPQWTDRGEDRLDQYWHQWSFGALTASGEARREALRRLLPHTKIAERVEVEDRFLRVRGDLHTYRIHLGTANVRVEPDDRYLCVVAGKPHQRGEHAPHVFLPFEEDGGRLSVIVAKAFLLADDTSITDRSLRHQLDAP
jgi:hypothetical protein